MNDRTETTSITFQMHPRAIAALGRDLVTNDVVAVIELVKNSYDALATRVDVRFSSNGECELPTTIEVLDDGHGMTRRTLEEVWSVVATPFRKDRPEAHGEEFARRVTGDKGLGRLSAARLGSAFELVTKAQADSFLRLQLDWDEIASAENLEDTGFEIVTLPSDPSEEIYEHGTRLRIWKLRNDWTAERIEELRENLARLVSPFSNHENFSIYLTVPGEEGGSKEVEIQSPEFLENPKYAIRGLVDETGNVSCKYEFQPLRNGEPRERSISIDWREIAAGSVSSGQHPPVKGGARCGPFEFEIRAWDLRAEDTLRIHEAFDIAKSAVRDAIRAHKGLSLYRDDILVLPKSDDARDWLGLDLRRVSRVGLRLSTSQIVGSVRITKQNNPDIVDTSDREGLASNPAVSDFRTILLMIIQNLEMERGEDRKTSTEKEEMVDLFGNLNADELVNDLGELAEEGASVSDAMPSVHEFSRRLDDVRSAIQTRFTYYSRLATVGTIAQSIIHEIRNRTTVIGRALKKLQQFLSKNPDEEMEIQCSAASRAVEGLERLASRFSPLATRTFRRGRRDSVLEESIERAVEFFDGELKSLEVDLQLLPPAETTVRIDPGELDAIVINLVSNALHWLAQVDGDRCLEFRATRISNGKRIRVHVDDSGPGVSEEDAERIFLPGITRKPEGIGMGLTVASELVREYGGEMRLARPGRLGGATFQFDLPLKT